MKTLVIARRGLVIGLCGYEVAAVATGRAPTITILCGRHKWLGPAVVAALITHLALQPRPQVAADCLLCPEPF